ncbi:hypothetical protein FOTG_12908 [Fusarium oxysporum f. sp. vasinfectum 25433]|uniref:Uncharacterized protein n=1 Tax=Fusarium oxysporum f. sp. vasinfectum 25433 TaxID=1089449 RepID=X0KZR5_FUSOX|nr:hypothetical protein FOTG_12908 [Fusarium oxysporum f. sp. vasinfectum 25433]
MVLHFELKDLLNSDMQNTARLLDWLQGDMLLEQDVGDLVKEANDRVGRMQGQRVFQVEASRGHVTHVEKIAYAF